MKIFHSLSRTLFLSPTLIVLSVLMHSCRDEAQSINPSPSYIFARDTGFVLVKNWDFGTSGNIGNTEEMSAEFVYHDQFGTIANGTNYGAVIVAPDAESALDSTPTGPQPVEDLAYRVRRFSEHSLRTYLVPLNGADTCYPERHNAGCGSFMARFSLPGAGSLLGKDILWETRVKYVTPPYFWFALWNAGIKWNRGAEIDLMESFGYDNGGGKINYDGRFWHSNSIGGPDEINYDEWNVGMKDAGIVDFDPASYHIWQLIYRRDNSFSCYVDGIEIQRGNSYQWTLQHEPGGEPIDFWFLFDAGWGHIKVASVNKPLPATAFVGKYYEWDYSRVYLR